jgi:two-component system response regulator NreC
MVFGETVRAGVVANVVEDQRLGFLDEQAQHARAVGRVADLVPEALVDAAGEELLEFGASAVENAERGVAGTGELAGGVQGVHDHRLRVGLADEAAADLDQSSQAGLVELHDRVVHAPILGAKRYRPGGKSAETYGKPARLRQIACLEMHANPETGENLTLVLVDDHAVVRTALKVLLESEPDLEVVAEAGNADDAIRYVGAHKPDVLVLDLNMPGRPSLEAIPDIKAASPGTEIVILTMRNEPAFARQALQAGVTGYVLKEAADSELVLAVRRAAEGETYLQPSLYQHLADRDRAEGRRGRTLSDREVEVMRLIALGHTNSEIADQLFLSVRTVESHRANIQKKLNLSSRAELVRYALDQGLISTQ